MRWVGEDVSLGQLLRHWPLEIRQVQLHTARLRIIERLDLERIFEDQAGAGDRTDGALVGKCRVGEANEWSKRERRRQRL